MAIAIIVNIIVSKYKGTSMQLCHYNNVNRERA